MKDQNEKIIGTRERDDVLLNFVSKQAQEAILDPNLPAVYKDEVLDAAVETIQKVAERKAVYYAKYGEGRRTRKPHIIYEASDHEEERDNTPPIIMELNENLSGESSDNLKHFSVEWIAEKAGINKNTLYEWVESDSEFTTALGRLKEAQENDPFKTGTEEDTFVNAMMIALVVMETRNRHYKSQNL
jgi:hypothetical protein